MEPGTTPRAATTLFGHGFTDIISVLPPAALLSPTSRLRADQRGKVPGKKLPDGTWVGFHQWLKHETTAADAEQWARDGANIGLRTARFPAVDIDCTNDGLSRRIAEIARDALGPAPSRIGQAPKQLLLYRTVDPFRRLRLWIKDSENGNEHLVEVLGAGQQFVATGIHPKTNQPYRWDCDIDQLTPDQLTTIDRDAVERFLSSLQHALEPQGFTCRREGRGGSHADRSSINQAHLKAPRIEVLREAVRCIPNTNAEFPGRDDYIRMGYAIRAASQDEPEAGFEIFSAWAFWEGEDHYDGNTPETVRSDWERMQSPYEIGWDYIRDLARGHGFADAALDFEADLTEEQGDTPAAILYSEQDLADTFINEHGPVLRYVPLEKAWYTWDGVRWSRDVRLRAHELAKATLRTIADRVARSGVTPQEQAKGLRLARTLSARAKVTNILELPSSDSRVVLTPDEFDADLWILNTPAGMIDLRTAETHPNNPTTHLTKTTTARVDRDGDATRWLQFLHEATRGDQELQRYLQRLAGYCVTGSVSEHVVVFVHGGGGNGKSVFLNTLAHVLGDYATEAPMSTFLATTYDRHPTEIAALRGARLVAASETDSRGTWNEARLKSLSGGDPLTARLVYRDFFTFQPQFTLLLVGNHRPQLSNVDDAIRRRLHLVPFTHKPEEPDPDLPEKLRAEAGAILAWMIQGCLDWQREGLAPPPIVAAATEEYFQDEDALGSWIAECCDVAPTSTATTSELFTDWQEWANGRGEHPGSMKRFAQLLKNRALTSGVNPQPAAWGSAGRLA